MPNIINDVMDFAEYYRAVGMLESQSIRPPTDFYAEIKDRRDGKASAAGEPMPWDRAHFFQFRPGECTAWLGYNFHGKSRIAGMCCAWLMRTSKHLMASLEMPAKATLDRMISQCAGTENYSDSFMTSWLDWADSRLWLYDIQERTDAEKLLGLVYYAANELGVNHVWIDSLMQTKVQGDDRAKMARQADFVDDLCRSAKQLNVHVHLVMHLRKPDSIQGEEKIPDRYSARGAAELVDRPDNVIIVHRNVGKFRKMEEQNPPEDIDSWKDGTLVIDKQRHHRGKNGFGRIKMYESGGGCWNDEKRRINYPIDFLRERTLQSMARFQERNK